METTHTQEDKMLYVLHVQTEVEDECENHCELPAIYADRDKALARAKSEALGIQKRIEDDEAEGSPCVEEADELDIVEADVHGELIGYRVMNVETDYWHATVEVLSVGDVDLWVDLEEPA